MKAMNKVWYISPISKEKTTSKSSTNSLYTIEPLTLAKKPKQYKILYIVSQRNYEAKAKQKSYKDASTNNKPQDIKLRD